ncbi:hypothetical protein [Myroides odoratimimus]|uniref:hypothetical protein n=1 Tax=Myroides odoratimimus TaxID=76832 RepID=UPI003101076A
MLGVSLGFPCPEGIFVEEKCKKSASNPLAGQNEITFSLKYNNKDLQVEDAFSRFTYNENNLVETNYSKKWETSNQKEGWFYKYEYDVF